MRGRVGLLIKAELSTRGLSAQPLRQTRDIPLPACSETFSTTTGMTHSMLPSQCREGPWCSGLWESRAGSAEWGERCRWGERGTQCTIPGSQDAERRAELVGDASSSNPPCTWPRARLWLQRGGQLLPCLQSPLPWGGGSDHGGHREETDCQTLLLGRKSARAFAGKARLVGAAHSGRESEMVYRALAGAVVQLVWDIVG